MFAVNENDKAVVGETVDGCLVCFGCFCWTGIKEPVLLYVEGTLKQFIHTNADDSSLANKFSRFRHFKLISSNKLNFFGIL